MGRPITHELTGKTFGDLTVIGRSSRKAAYPYWSCVCSCGGKIDVASHNLRRVHGGMSSCGCKTAKIRSDALRGKNTTHGLTVEGQIPPEYEVWRSMRRRCEEVNNAHYKDYGARGITVCARWQDFGKFFTDMGPRPGTRHTLERKNNSVGYTPKNCCWATYKVQANNKRNNFVINFRGEKHTLSEWASKLGIRSCTLQRRLRALGWSVEAALTRPLRRYSVT